MFRMTLDLQLQKARFEEGIVNIMVGIADDNIVNWDPFDVISVDDAFVNLRLLFTTRFSILLHYNSHSEDFIDIVALHLEVQSLSLQINWWCSLLIIRLNLNVYKF